LHNQGDQEMNRYFIWEQSGYERSAGNQKGYARLADAVSAAKKLANKTGKVHGIGDFEILPGGERDCIQVIGYEEPIGK
jgi:hypothetical protein